MTSDLIKTLFRASASTHNAFKPRFPVVTLWLIATARSAATIASCRASSLVAGCLEPHIYCSAVLPMEIAACAWHKEILIWPLLHGGRKTPTPKISASLPFSRADLFLTKNPNWPYKGQFCGNIGREGSCSKAAGGSLVKPSDRGGDLIPLSTNLCSRSLLRGVSQLLFSGRCVVMQICSELGKVMQRQGPPFSLLKRNEFSWEFIAFISMTSWFHRSVASKITRGNGRILAPATRHWPNQRREL